MAFVQRAHINVGTVTIAVIFSLVNESFNIGSTSFEPRHFVNCETRGLVYLLTGGYNAFYVGKTRCMLWQRVKAHAADINDKIPISPVAKHFADCLSFNIDTLRFRVLERIHQGP